MTNKHTPGPWKIERKQQSDYEHLYITHESEFQSGIVADLHSPVLKYSDGRTEDNQRILANARLIAAAPELLEALRRLIVCPDLYFDGLEDESIEALEQARAAIKKAKGE